MRLLTQDEADKQTDIFVGMWRPPYPDIENKFKGCTYGMFPGSKELRDAYLRGDFDEPLYRRIDLSPASVLEGRPLS